MNILYEEFTQCCPAGEVPDSGIFESIAAQILRWKEWARELATPDIYDKLDNIDAEPITEDYDRLVSLRRYLVGMICSFAFEDAIPQLDLVLTPTGFGIVSNQNVAPASVDRVNALKTRMRNQGWTYFEEAVDVLRYLGAFKTSKLCASVFQSLFWKSSHLHVFGIPNPTYDNLREKNRDIIREQPFLIQFISPEQFGAFLRSEALATTTTIQGIAIQMCRVYFAIEGTQAKNSQKLAILNFMEQHSDEFPEYMNSVTYKANHFQRYENQKDDSCFFFG